ncbi:hypothetical protein KKE26_08730 [bacterium]|nr:hypothetical protein [bacterium]
MVVGLVGKDKCICRGRLCPCKCTITSIEPQKRTPTRGEYLWQGCSYEWLCVKLKLTRQ